MICPYCKSDIKAGLKFCTNCGQPLENTMQAGTPQPEADGSVIPQAPPYGGIGQRGPSRWFYAVSALILIVGVVSFVFLLMGSLKGLDSSLARIVVPGKYDINLAEKGKYTIFYEYQSLIGNKVYHTGPRIPYMGCNIVSKVTKQPVNLTSPSMDYSYSLGRAGVAVLEFTVDQPGPYEITVWYPEGRTGQEIVLAIGKGFKEKIMNTIIGCIAVLGGAIVLAILIFVVTFIKRRRARRAAV